MKTDKTPVLNAIWPMNHIDIYGSLTALLMSLCLLISYNAHGQIKTSWFDINPSKSNLDDSDPNGSSGGRVQNLGAAGDLSKIYAATEWGGLYSSRNQGLTWIRENTFEPSATWDVKVDPGNSRRVYVTSFYNSRISRTSGINISVDGGTTWTVAPGPPRASSCVNDATAKANPAGWQIAIDPRAPRTVYVGTNCGLARSFDSGATWDYVDPSPADNAETVFAVIAHGGNIVDVISANGYFRSTNNGNPGTWSAAIVGPGPTNGGAASSLAVSPAENYVLYATQNAQNIWESDNGGANWPTSISLPLRNGQSNVQGRIPFIKTNQRASSNQFDIWYGDQNLFKMTAITPSTPAPGGTPRALTSLWSNVQSGAHWDVADVLFDPTANSDARPMLYANDGGVYRNTGDGQSPSWEQPNVTPHATWIFGFDGADMGDREHAIYYGLQDNGAWGTTTAKEGPSNPVPGWNNSDCCDSFDEAAQSDLVVYTQGAKQTGRVFPLYRRGAGLSGGGEIPNYPSAAEVINFNSRRGISRFSNNAYAVLMSDGGVHTTNNINAGSISWTNLSAPTAVNSGIGGIKTASTPGQVTSVFYHTGRGTNVNSVGQVFRRATSGAGAWQLLPLPTGITGVSVYGVDSNNANRLIISGIDGANNFSIWVTSNYGANWTPMPALDNQITASFRNQTTSGPTNFTGFSPYWQPSMFEFNPADGNTIVTGTVDAGIYLTTNFGSNWRLISRPVNPTSAVPHIPRPLYAHFSPTRFSSTSSSFDIWFGSQGAGVHKVLVESGPGIDP